jgi:hypothetical protein
MTRRTEVVYISYESMIKSLQETEIVLAGLSPATIRILLVTAAVTRSAFQREEAEPLEPYIKAVVLQLNWLAEQALNDEGLVTEESRLPAFHAVNDRIAEIEANERARLKTPSIGLPSSKDN